jgi:N-acetylneuraminic acid mutarotase
VRYHFISSFGWWWEVDDVSVQNRSCDPIPGGLVVGNVTDANTGSGINGATVTSNDHSADKAVTVHKPDTNVGDGYYWLFSSLTGTHPFTATKSPYQADSHTVNVAANGTTGANFSLKVGKLTITPSSISKTQVLGTTTTTTVSIQNTGTAPANVKLDERGGSFQILTQQGAPLRLIQADDGALAYPGFLGSRRGTNGLGTNAGSPKDPTWSTIAQYPSGIMDNSADFIDGKEYSVGGIDNTFAVVAKGYVYDPSANTWTAIADMPVAREKPGVAAVNGKLYVTGGWDSAGNPIARTDVYDPATNTWSTVASVNPHPAAAPGVAVANGKIYLVGGCGDAFCTTNTNVVSYDPTTDSWSSLAAYPHNDAWEGCGGISGKVYCAGGTDGASTFKNGFVLDPSANTWSPIADMPIDLWASSAGAANGLLLESSGVTNGFSTITNQGYAYDPAADSWTALPNAQFPRYRAGGSCGFYKIGGSSGGFNPTPDSELLSGLTQCGVTDVPWLAENPTSTTVQPGQTVNVTITLSATTAAKVTQPGTYTAQLGIEHNTPYVVNPINITMLVTPPNGFGKIAGTVTVTDCKGNTVPLKGVQIQANGTGQSFSLTTDANGAYAFWAAAATNSYTIIASKDGWIAQVTMANVKGGGQTVTVNFNLQKLGC